MSTSKNRHGLARYIPEDVKLALRQECGGGCVHCGLAIGQYEHIEPEYRDATEHDPAKMAYLCGGCHDRVTRGVWSKELVWRDKVSPWSKRHGHCHDAFDIGTEHPSIWLGPVECRGIRNLIRLDGEVLLSIDPPEFRGHPYRVSGKFFDDNGQLELSIDRNEWRIGSGVWDVRCHGRTLEIRSSPGKTVLRITSWPPKGLGIDILEMRYKGFEFLGNRDEFYFGGGGFGGNQLVHGKDDPDLVNLSSDRPNAMVITAGAGRLGFAPGAAEPFPWPV